MDSSISKSQPSLPSKFVTLVDLRERWLKQKELERKGKELQERQQQEAKQNQLYSEVQSQSSHRRDLSQVRPNRNRFRSRGTYKERESNPVGSLSSGADESERSEVGIGVGFENIELKEKGKEMKKTDEKPKVGRGKRNKKSPNSVENEVVNEVTQQVTLGKKREMKEKEKVEDIEASGRIGNDGSTSKLDRESKNILKIEKKFGKFLMNDRRSDIFTRPRNTFNYSFRYHNDRKVVRNHLDKGMIWMRKDSFSSGKTATGNTGCSKEKLHIDLETAIL